MTLPGGASRAFLWFEGEFVDLGSLGGRSSEVHGMNDDAKAVGWAEMADGTVHAVLWSNGRIRDLGRPVGTTASIASTINLKDQTVGKAVSPTTGALQAFLLDNGEFTMLGTLPGYSYGSESTGINEASQICGISYGDSSGSVAQAFIWENGLMRGLGSLYGLSSYTRKINNLGQIVGRVGNGPQRRAFLYQGDVMVDLNTLIAPGSGWTLLAARDINDSGQIIGIGLFGGVPRAFLLTPSTLRTFCIEGDVNCDGCVDDADLLAILFAFGSTGDCLPEDLNRDGVVDDSDLLEVLFNFGSGC